MQHPLLYEINTRCWLAQLSADAGARLTLADVPESEFQFWQHCGFTHVWLMGVWTLGRRGREHSRRCHGEGDLGCTDIVGSPYAITAYTVSRRLGGETALAAFRRKLHARGIKLVLDFIPNHTALDHPWGRSCPDFYVRSDQPGHGLIKPYRGATKWFAHGDCGHGSPWVDTLQLEYRNPDLRRAMLDTLLSVAGKCDGVRCDMAMLVLNDVFAKTWQKLPCAGQMPSREFWTEALAAARLRHPDCMFLAEVYWDLETRLQEIGFDFTYDKRLYDRLVARDATGASRYLKSLTREFMNHSAHFIENHDEPRIASLLSFEEHRAAAVLTVALPGLRLLHEGQLTGARLHANVHFARRGIETTDEQVPRFYRRLLDALPQTVVGRGEWKLLIPQPAWPGNPTHENFVIVQWQQKPGAFDLVVVNLGNTSGQCFVPLEIDGIEDTAWQFTDLLSDEVHRRDGHELARQGLYLDVGAQGAQIMSARIAHA